MALKIDPSLPEAHTALAFTRLVHDWDWGGAEEEFKLALELNTNQALSHCWYAFYLAAVGRLDEAIFEVKASLALDPLSLVANTHVGWILYLTRRYDEALRQLNSVLEMDPDFAMAHGYLGVLYFQKMRYREAQREFGKAFKAFGNPTVYAALRECYEAARKGEPARIVQDDLLSPYLRAIVQLSVGRKEQAMDSLEQAYATRAGWLIFLGLEPTLDGLRSDPRFEVLLRRLGLTPDSASQERSANGTPATGNAVHTMN